MTDLSVLVLNCTLKPSPAPSSSDKLSGQLVDAMKDVAQQAGHTVAAETVRVVDHDVHPGVEADMGDGDQWPQIRSKILAADVLVLATPTWMGQQSSVCQRVLERLDAEVAETDEAGRPILYGKVAAVTVVGNEDGAHHISAVAFQCLNDVGFTIAAQAATYWNGEAMNSTDYNDLDETPEAVASTTKGVATNTVHLAAALAASNYPA
ncbi:flavodoxin family protein [Nocardioides mangrovicus]|uniref:Flavodoxin family protein n=1 Tax=Nocardioides mangrovicus TaxID=2478913 RepID=A0A3L8P7S4_9ACTN|nr:NAD(P)H-dependent oxidoreductase [Nocardioides mangrovicus]RLV51271.1 flavodoxin family protein [Nocardioides mangrovicus]